MTIAIDIGNTRLKWGVHEDGVWRAQGALPTAGAASLAGVAGLWPAQGKIVACNVAGAAVESVVTAALGAQAGRLCWLRSGAQAGGVRNGYEPPEKLGADRWAALIGARSRHRGDCLVVMSGTATTVDLLTGDGRFLGGLILPGLALMRDALAGGTANLPAAAGEFAEQPRNTFDAIASGALQATAGALERMFRGIAGGADPLCLLSGGAAAVVAGVSPPLTFPHRIVDNLVLEGLAAIAESSGRE